MKHANAYLDEVIRQTLAPILMRLTNGIRRRKKPAGTPIVKKMTRRIRRKIIKSRSRI